MGFALDMGNCIAKPGKNVVDDGGGCIVLLASVFDCAWDE